MFIRDHSTPVGTNTGRDLPCDATYKNEAGDRVHLEVSLEALQTLPEECDYVPCGAGIRVREWEYAAVKAEQTMLRRA